MEKRGLRIMKTVEIRIAPDGSITAQTQGYTGKSCMNAMPFLQRLCDGSVVQSSFLEAEETQIQNIEIEREKQCHT